MVFRLIEKKKKWIYLKFTFVRKIINKKIIDKKIKNKFEGYGIVNFYLCVILTIVIVLI